MPHFNRNFNILSKLKKKLTHNLCKLKFLLTCKRNEVVPKSLQIKLKILQQHNFENLKNAFHKNLLNKAIKNIRKEISYTEYKVYNQYLLSTKVMKLNFDKPYAALCCYCETLKKNIENKHAKKLEFLIKKEDKINNLQNMKNKGDNFINLTNCNLDEITKRALNKGKNFCYPPKLPPLGAIIPEIEESIQKIPEEDKEIIRCKFVSEYNKYKNEKQQMPDNIKKEIIALKKLKQTKDLKIMSSDKTSQLVLLNVVDFDKKANKCIQDLNVTEINKDPTEKIINQLHNLKNNKVISKPFEFKLPLYPAPPSIFFTIKTHKQEMPFRPIITKFHAPTIELEKKLSIYLKPLIENNKYCINSSQHFIENLKKIEITKTTKIFKMDVVSLFPNIPIDRCLDIINYNITKYPDLHKYASFIIKSLKIIMLNNYFKYKNRIYIQEKGTSIGSPLSPLLAEVILQDLENKILSTNLLKPCLYYRYVDDCLIFWKFTNDSFQKLFQKFNSYHKDIKFTIEEEKNRSINFLDVLITKGHKNLYYDVYRKEFDTNTIIPYSSYCPNIYKFSAIRSHISRAISHTKYKFQEIREIKRIKQKTKEKGYPPAIVNKIISKVKNKENTNKSQLMISKENKKTYKVIYSTSLTYYPFYKKIINQIKKKYNICIPYRNNKNLEDLINNSKEKSKPTGGVYRIPILDENQQMKYYIGRTRRTINKRLQEHKDSLTNIYGATSLKKYLNTNIKSEPLWEKTEILSSPKTDFQLNKSELIKIIQNKNTCINNNTEGALSKIWTTQL